MSSGSRRTALAMLTAVLLQILSNLANDYGDSVHGADRAERLGPRRAVQSGLISAAAMKTAMGITALLSAASGLALLWAAFGAAALPLLLFVGLGAAAIGAAILAEQYEMQWFPDDDLFAISRPRGLPIGNLTSQFWANVYLNPFDHFVKRELRCAGYLRYVDDFLLFADDKKTLWRWRQAIVERLQRLRLTIHAHAHPRPVSEGIPFLGFVVYPQQRCLKRRKGIYFRRRLRRLLAEYAAGFIPLTQVDASVNGWVNHARYGNTVGLRAAVLGSCVVYPPRRLTRRRSAAADVSG